MTRSHRTTRSGKSTSCPPETKVRTCRCGVRIEQEMEGIVQLGIKSGGWKGMTRGGKRMVGAVRGWHGDGVGMVGDGLEVCWPSDWGLVGDGETGRRKGLHAKRSLKQQTQLLPHIRSDRRTHNSWLRFLRQLIRTHLLSLLSSPPAPAITGQTPGKRTPS